MTHALNLVLPIKQHPDTLASLARLKENFQHGIQQEIEDALRKSEIVHFARVFVIEDKYIQVITEYEGAHDEYAEFFRKKLKPIFEAIFSLADGAPQVDDPAAFWNYSKSKNIRSLGQTTSGSTTMDGEPAGWLFSAYDHKTVREVKAAMAAGAGTA